MFCENYDKLVSNLEGRGFTVHSAASGEEAKKLVLELIGDRASVGCGGSMTISSLGLPDALRAQGNPVYFHWDVKPEERAEIFEKAKEADWYLCSTNAITMNAKLINIDGNGNRVAAMFGGPKKVVLVSLQPILRAAWRASRPWHVQRMHSGSASTRPAPSPANVWTAIMHSASAPSRR